jgi:hypothetical protein
MSATLPLGKHGLAEVGEGGAEGGGADGREGAREGGALVGRERLTARRTNESARSNMNNLQPHDLGARRKMHAFLYVLGGMLNYGGGSRHDTQMERITAFSVSDSDRRRELSKIFPHDFCPP